MQEPSVCRPFGGRLRAAIAVHGHLCVGVDPHPASLREWGLADQASAAEHFAHCLIEAAAGRVPAIKVQVALFERFGAVGYAALERVLARARQAGLLVIADAKRGDIGSTMLAYAQAWLSDDSPLAADALTVNPYTGFGSLVPAVELAERSGRGVYVLVLTSNPEGADLQHRGSDGAGSVAAAVMRACQQANKGGAGGGSVGVVIGATVAQRLGDCAGDLEHFSGPVLVPGFGTQGAEPAQVLSAFAPVYGSVLVNSSRAIAQVGPSISALQAAIDGATQLLARNV